MIETVAVIGFSTSGRGREPMDGLYVARIQGGRLVYAGKVMDGLTEAVIKELEARLRPLVTA